MRALLLSNLIPEWLQTLTAEQGTAVSTFGLLIFTVILAGIAYITYQNGIKIFKKERFESRFFEMVKIYRENVQEMELTLPEFEQEKKIYGRLVFSELNRHYLILIQSIQAAATYKEYPFKSDFELPMLSYLVLFFGFSNIGKEMLLFHFKELGYDENAPFIKYIMESSDLGKHNAAYSKPNDMPPTSYPYYAGNQLTLGHYFRHLYQTVMYVHKQDFLTRQEKYDYVKMLRTQMSTYEQAIFFYNAFSPMGAIWEFSKRNKDYSPLQKQWYDKKDLLITEYRLIKNIPKGFTGKLVPKDFFSELIFEYQETA